jgi:hypothetical protein
VLNAQPVSARWLGNSRNSLLSCSKTDGIQIAARFAGDSPPFDVFLIYLSYNQDSFQEYPYSSFYQINHGQSDSSWTNFP